MLKEIVDETSRGKYDFMYLRIGKSAAPNGFVPKLTVGTYRLREQLQVRHPFLPIISLFEANLASVGYAFINFEDVSHEFPMSIDDANRKQPYYIIDVSYGH